MNWLADDLHVLEERSMRRHLRTVEKAEGVHLVIAGKDLINFASNNYLGLSHHPLVIQAASDAMKHWGAGATASRLLAGNTQLHQNLEKSLAEFLKCEATLIFSTGFMTNLGAVTALVGSGDAVIMDRLSHASLVDAARLSGAKLFVYSHADAESAEKVLVGAQTYRRRLLITESLYSMDGDIAPLRRLAALARKYNAISYLDEAHAMGVWGYQGRGVLGMEGMDDRWDVVVGTLSKAFGSQGGFVAGDHVLIQTLINKARPFLFTTALSPVCVAAAQAALALIESDPSTRSHVQRLSAQLRDGLRLQQWDILNSTTQIVPIVLEDAEEAIACAEYLYLEGFFAPAIRPPTVPNGTCRLRFSVTADHTSAHIKQLLEALDQFPHQPKKPSE